MAVAQTVLVSWSFPTFNRKFSARFNKNAVVSVDNCHPVLRADPRYPAEPAPRRQLPDPGADPRRGVCRGPQVHPAWTAEAVKNVNKHPK